MHVHGAHPASSPAVARSHSGLDARRSAGAGRAPPFPLEAPRYQATTAEAGPDTLRHYDIRDEQGHLHPIYTIVVAKAYWAGRRRPGQHLDRPPAAQRSEPDRADRLAHVQPLLRRRTRQDDRLARRVRRLLDRKHPHRQPLAAGDGGDRPGHPARRHPRGPSDPDTRGGHGGHDPHSVALPPPGTTTVTSLPVKLAVALSFVVLAVLGLLAVLVLVRRRELKQLREQVADALQLEARLRPRLAAAGGVARPERTPPAQAAREHQLLEREPTRAPLRGSGPTRPSRRPNSAPPRRRGRGRNLSLRVHCGSPSHGVALPTRLDSGCAWVPGTPAAA